MKNIRLKLKNKSLNNYYIYIINIIKIKNEMY